MILNSDFTKRTIKKKAVLSNLFCHGILKKAALSTLFSAMVTLFFLPTASAAKTNKKPIRWFEMEVILFSQLGDKNLLNEDFTNNNSLPTYKGIRELLTDYLQPDLKLLQRQLPFCASLNSDSPYVPFINTATINEQLIQKYQQSLMSPIDVALLFNNSLKNNTTATTPLAPFDSHSDKYAPFEFTREVCQLLVKDKISLQKALPDFDENSIKIDSIPKTINGIENLASDVPYLISKSSLQLHDIVKKLRSSREFKPMLHIGWRQSEPAINTKKSIPMHLFAGENLLANYQQALQQFEQEQQLAQEQELLLQTVFNTNNTQGFVVTEADKNHKIQQIVTSLNYVPEDKKDLISQLDLLASNHQSTTYKQAPETQIKAPIKPSQDWSIDGLFNVHLDHYLYITADFNIANMTLAEQASESLAKGEPQAIKSIRFSQNKRVISKEIHYFDHPYMGMIVQIRRYKRPTPEEIKTIKVAQSSSLLTN